MTQDWTNAHRKLLADMLATGIGKDLMERLRRKFRPYLGGDLAIPGVDPVQHAALRAARYEGQEEVLHFIEESATLQPEKQELPKPYSHIKPPTQD